MEPMVVLMAVATFLAGCVAGLALAILYAVYEIMLPEKSKCAEYTTLVHCAEFGFKFAEGISTAIGAQRLKHKQSIGRRAYVVLQ